MDNNYSKEFFELSNEMLCIANFEGYFIRVNRTWTEVLGYSAQELVGKPFVSFVHPDDIEATNKVAAGLSFGTEVVSFENRYRTKAGEYRTLLWKSSSDLSKKVIYAVARDITEIKKKELSLLEDNERFQQILNNIEDFILLKDRECRLLYANRSFREFYGFTLNEDIQGIFDKTNNDPELLEKYLQDDRYVVETKNRLTIPWEYTVRHDQVKRKLKCVKSPIFDDQGKVIMTMGVSQDITDEMEREELIKEQQVKMIDSARLSSLGEMAAGIAHEINNPLTIIDAIIYQAKSQIERGQIKTEELGAVFDRMVKSLDRIAKIVRSLRFFSRNSDKDPYTVASLQAIVQETAELCHEKFKFAQIDLRLEDVKDCKALCRPTEIGQVLLNLITNAFDAVEGTTKAWVRIEVRRRNQRVVISVQDSGSGIPRAIQDTMMNPFFTTKEVGRGTGLGLSIALGIVKSHGGELVYSETEGHTTFSFDLQSADS